MARKATSKHLPGERDALRLRNLSTDQASLEASADFGEPPEVSGSGSTATCYNPRCADYRRPRPAEQSCGCKKTSVR